jgi:hypothetical protein
VDFEASTWSRLQAFIRAVHTEARVDASYEELYGVRAGTVVARGQAGACGASEHVLAGDGTVCNPGVSSQAA